MMIFSCVVFIRNDYYARTNILIYNFGRFPNRPLLIVRRIEWKRIKIFLFISQKKCSNRTFSLLKMLLCNTQTHIQTENEFCQWTEFCFCEECFEIWFFGRNDGETIWYFIWLLSQLLNYLLIDFRFVLLLFRTDHRVLVTS